MRNSNRMSRVLVSLFLPLAMTCLTGCMAFYRSENLVVAPFGGSDRIEVSLDCADAGVAKMIVRWAPKNIVWTPSSPLKLVVDDFKFSISSILAPFNQPDCSDSTLAGMATFLIPPLSLIPDKVWDTWTFHYQLVETTADESYLSRNLSHTSYGIGFSWYIWKTDIVDLIRSKTLRYMDYNLACCVLNDLAANYDTLKRAYGVAQNNQKWLAEGERLLAGRQYKEAAAAYGHLVAKKRRKIEITKAYQAWCDALIAQAKYEEALNMCAGITQEGNWTGLQDGVLDKWGKSLCDKGDFAQASQIYSRIQSPETRQGRLDYVCGAVGNKFAEAGKFDSAMEQFSKISDKHGQWRNELRDKAAIAAGDQAAAKYQYDEAVRWYSKIGGANQAGTKLTALNVRWAGAMYDQGKFDEAIACLERIKTTPKGQTRFLVMNNIGVAYARQGNNQKALDALTEALSASDSPQYRFTAYFNRAKVWSNSGDIEKSAADLTQAMDLDSNRVDQAKDEYIFLK